MRSPFAYVPRRAPLQSASPGAAVAYLGAYLVIAFLYSNPVALLAAAAAAALAGALAGARRAVRAALRMGLSLLLLIVIVNALVVGRGETVLARLWDLPVLSPVVTLEAIVEGFSMGLRAAVAIIAFAVYSACVDPDQVLRALRPFAGRSALTATLTSRLVPVAASDYARLGDAARLRGPGAAPAGRAALARRLLAGTLDRAVDVAATLELRGYGLDAPAARSRKSPPRFNRRFYAAAALLLAAAVAGKLLGADGFDAYPRIHIALGVPTLALSALLLLGGLVPLQRSRRRAEGTNRGPYRGTSSPRRQGPRKSFRRPEVARV